MKACRKNKLIMKTKIITLLLLLSLFIGCGTTQNLESPAASADRQVVHSATRSATTSTLPDHERPQEAPGHKIMSPVRIAVFQDKSRSVNETRTIQLTEEDFLFLIGILRITSGELAFGIVDDKSSRPLLRLRIEAAPPRPVEEVVSNVFERAESDAAYQQELTKYEAKLKEWRDETDANAKAFIAKLKPLLEEKAGAGRTNVYEAIARINLFAGESEASWPVPTHRYAVVNSDCIDTVHSKPVKISDQVKLVLINGAGSTGVLESAHPLRFESVQAALDFIRANEK